MKKMMKLLMVVVLGLSMLACGGKEEDKTIVVGTAPNFVPFEYMDGDKIVGFDMELLDEISKESGLKFKVVGMDFSGLLPALQTKKIDMIMSGMSVTEDRKKNVDFSTAYFTVEQVVMLNEKADEITGEEEFTGKKIGVVMGTTSDVLAEEMAKKYEGVEVVKYNKIHEAVLALKEHKLDMIFLDDQQGKKTVENNDGVKLSSYILDSEDYAIAINKGEEETLNKINTALEKILKSEKYNELMKQYID